MSLSTDAPAVHVMQVLRACGWVPDDNRPWSEEPPLKYNFGNFELSAGVVINEYFCRVVSFQGLYTDHRTIVETAFEIPECVESREQALARLAYGLRDKRQLAITPAWIDEGRRWEHELPMVKRKAAYNNRPRADIERMWMKPLGKVLREVASSAALADQCIIHFDGSVVRFDLLGRRLLVQGDGPQPWAIAVSVCVRDLSALPQRWMPSTIEISYWDGHLAIGNRRFLASEVSPPSERPVQDDQ